MTDRKVACAARGCSRSWLWRGSDQRKALAAGDKSTPERLCDLCHARTATLVDRELSCVTPGCGTSTNWTSREQLEAIHAHKEAGAPPTPRHACAACAQSARSLGDMVVPCRMESCTQTWSWTGSERLAAGGESATATLKMCASCDARLGELRDRKVRCRTEGCQGGWTWPRLAQLEDALAGRGHPAERACDRCHRELAELADEQHPCRVTGCAGTWTLSKVQQLEAHRAGEGRPPARMCAPCQSAWAHIRDLDVPCKRGGCKGTWSYRRGAQLERLAKQRKTARPASAEGVPPAPLAPPAPPSRLCDACGSSLGAFTDRPVPCKHKPEGCKGTWIWTRFAQLQAKPQGSKSKPPTHVCDACRDFLEGLKSKIIACVTCAASIHWSADLQLRTKFGAMQEPTLCGACKRKLADASRRPASTTS